jgi:hypothetical protein
MEIARETLWEKKACGFSNGIWDNIRLPGNIDARIVKGIRYE